jgi:hypothetical protein
MRLVFLEKETQMSSGGDHRFGERMAFSGGAEDTPIVQIGRSDHPALRPGMSKRMVTFFEGEKVIMSVSVETLERIVKWALIEDFDRK